MKTPLFVALILLVMVGITFAQQDPNDPGIQDSIIIGYAVIDSGMTYVGIPVWAVTDDSVDFYNIPLTWHSEHGGIQPSTPNLYFPPLTSWDDIFDRVIDSLQLILMLGWRDLDYDSTDNNVPLNTFGQRVQVMTLRFMVDPYSPNQNLYIDTTYDHINGSILFGLPGGLIGFTPAVVGHPYVGIEEIFPPCSFKLSQNYPNPFNPSTNIDFAIADDGRVSLIVYDLLGRQVKTLLDENLKSGRFTVTWDGKDESSGDVPSGVYFYRITSAGFSESKRMILLR